MKFLSVNSANSALFFFLLLFWGAKVEAQKISLESGSFSPLKGTSSLNMEYIYDNLTVGEISEQDYILKKTTEYNTEEPGKGDKWLQNWKNDRENRYQPSFEEAMTENLRSAGIKAGPYTDSRYTMIVKTTMIEPGWNVGVARRPAIIDVEISIVETADKSKLIAKAIVKKSTGNDAWGYDFDTGYRIEKAYSRCAQKFAKFMFKNGLK